MTAATRSGKPAINRKIHYGDKTFLVTCTKVKRDYEIGDIIRVNSAPADIFGDATSVIIGKNIKEYRSIFGKDILNQLSAKGKKKVNLQVKLLRVLQEQEIIQALLNYFLGKYNKKYGLSESFDAAAIKQMLNYDWSGNVRELENMVERFVVTSDGDTIMRMSDWELFEAAHPWPHPREISFRQNYKDLVSEYETILLNKALEQYGTTRKMSDALGLNQSTIVKKMSRLGISSVTK